MSSNSDIVDKSVTGVFLLFGLTLVKKLGFILNIMLQRRVLRRSAHGKQSGIEDYGAACIGLELILNSTIFLTREPFRLALARDTSLLDPSSSRLRKRAAVTAAWMFQLSLPYLFLTPPHGPSTSGWLTTISTSKVVPCGFVMAVIVWFVYTSVVQVTYPVDETQPSFGSFGSFIPSSSSTAISILIMCAAAALELCCEPLAIIYLNRLNFGVRVVAEGIGAIVLASCKFKFVVNRGMGVIGFSLAQLLHSVVLLIVYYGCCALEVWRAHFITPSTTTIEQQPSGTFFGSISSWLPNPSACKLLLIEGDKLALTRDYASSSTKALYRHGVYAIGHSYGSLVPRLILAPVEETSRLLFCKLSCSSHKSDGLREHSRLLCTVLKFVLLLGGVFAAIGSNYTTILLELLLGGHEGKEETLEGICRVLSWYCLYVLFLCVNGTLEAFVFAVAEKAQLTGLTLCLVVAFAVFWFSSTPLVQYFGTEGIVIANCLSMVVRIGYCIWFMRTFFGELGQLRNAIPHPAVFVSFIAAFILTHRPGHDSGLTWEDEAGHVVKGIICTFGLIGSILIFERPFINELSQLIWSKRKKLAQD